MKQLNRYLNGNYYMESYDDGTNVRVKVNPDDTELKPVFPDSLYLKIAEVKDTGVVLADILYNSYTPKVKPYTDIAIIGCNPLVHPALIKFAEEMKLKNVNLDLTVSQPDIIADILGLGIVLDLVRRNLIRSLNIVLTDSTDEKLYNIFDVLVKPIIQVTNGVVTSEDLDNLSNKRIAIKIVGFVSDDDIDQNKPQLSPVVMQNMNMLGQRLKTKPVEFSVVGLDRLAAEQLGILNNDYFIFDANKQSMYIDLANGLYSNKLGDEKKLKLPVPPTSLSDIFQNIQHEYKM